MCGVNDRPILQDYSEMGSGERERDEGEEKMEVSRAAEKRFPKKH